MIRKRHRTSLQLRAAALMLAALQLGASTVIPAADAVLDAEPVGAPMHVESPGSEDCAAPHDHLFCQVVRSLSSGARDASPVILQDPRPLVVVGLEHETCDVTHCALLPGATHPRAPPLG